MNDADDTIMDSIPMDMNVTSSNEEDAATIMDNRAKHAIRLRSETNLKIRG